MKKIHMKSRILALTVLAALCLTCLPLTALASGARFTDVPQDSWSYPWVMEAAELKLVSGTSATTFEPWKDTTIAHFATVLTSAFYGDELSKATTTGEWWSVYLETANNKKLLTGTSAYRAYSGNGQTWTHAIAEQSLTRNEMADVLARLLEDKGLLPSQDKIEAARAAISDYAQIPSQYRDAAAICVAAGVLAGKGNGRFAGEDHFSRAEMACICVGLYHMVNKPAGPDPVDPAPAKPDGPTLANGAEITQENVRDIINSLREEYPEGMHWTNDNQYTSKAVHLIGHGCVGFALICSDTAFGNLPVTAKHSDFDAVRVGDMLRINNNTHTVVVLEKRENSVIVAEGNYNSSIHWDREITRADLEAGNFTVQTRYPE